MTNAWFFEKFNGVLVHNDLAPRNILINAKGRMKISDFGISFINSAPFMSGKSVKSSWPRNSDVVDIYNFGELVLYFILKEFDYGFI